jgi:xanthine/CO dehydrogenase XdhC/CoxF family maturation factor
MEQTPEEIAISIAAWLIAVRSNKIKEEVYNG